MSASKVSLELVQASKSKFLEARRGVEEALEEHIRGSEELLAQLKRSSCGIFGVAFLHVIVGAESSSDAPAFYVNNGSRSKVNANAQQHGVGSNGLDICINKTNKAPVNKLTQAEWLSRAKCVHSGLTKTSNWEDDVRIPEILLTDPADVLCGKKVTGVVNKVDPQDSLNKLLNDASYENAVDAELGSGTVNARPMSYDITSLLDLNKTGKDDSNADANTLGNNLVGKIIDETCKGLESLNFGITKHGGTSCNNPMVEGAPMSIQDLCIYEFGVNSGIDVTNNNINDVGGLVGIGTGASMYELTQSLVHINEQDKNKEAELAPKICELYNNTASSRRVSIVPGTVFSTKGGENNLGINKTTASLSSALVSNPLDALIVMRDTGLGIKGYKLSDFDKKLASYPASGHPNKEAQTDDPAVFAAPTANDESQAQDTDLAPRCKIRVETMTTRGLGRLSKNSDVDAYHSTSPLAQEEKYAKALTSNIKSSIGDADVNVAPGGSYRFGPNNSSIDAWQGKNYQQCQDIVERYKQELLELQQKSYDHWQKTRAPIYAKFFEDRRIGGITRVRGGARLRGRTCVL